MMSWKISWMGLLILMHAEFWCGIPLGKMGRRFKDGIKKDLKAILCEIVG
jgi:hypothetical protein